MEDIVGWDVGTWSRAVRFWDAQLGRDGESLDCLEMGAGPGGPSLWLASRGHRVVCSNLMNTGAMARPLHERRGVTSLIAYEDIDAASIPYTSRFDVIVFKSVLGGIGSNFASSKQAIDGMRAALKPGGRVFFAENLRGGILHRIVRALANRHRNAAWRFMTVGQYREMFRAFSSLSVDSTGVVAVFGLTERHRRALATIDDAVFNRVMPRSGRYMIYGVATK